MKRILLLLFVCTSFYMSAQLENGSKLTGDIIATDLADNPIDVQAWLADGKTVVIDVFAAWCGPCWTFHQSGYLENLYEEMGPEGTDQIRVLAIESEAQNSITQIYGPEGGEGALYTYGDWTEGVQYPIVDDASFMTLLDIGFFPTLYVIRPDGSVFEIGGYRFNDEVWAKLLVPQGEDVILLGSVPGDSFCDELSTIPNGSLINMSGGPISSASVDVYVNGELDQTIEITEEFDVFQSRSFSAGAYTIDGTTTFEMVATTVNGSPDVADELSAVSASLVKSEVKSNSTIQVNITTDFYPGETTWQLLNEAGDVLASDSYQAGTEDSFGGGGPDANITHEYMVDIGESDAGCMTLAVADSYGDGIRLQYSDPSTDPTPGFEIIDADGVVVRAVQESDYDGVWTNSKEINVLASAVSSVLDAELQASTIVYPNPVSEILNIEMEISNVSLVSASLVNTLGQTVSRVNYGKISGSNILTYDVSQMVDGQYSLHIIIDDKLVTKKVTVSK